MCLCPDKLFWGLNYGILIKLLLVMKICVVPTYVGYFNKNDKYFTISESCGITEPLMHI